METGYEFAPADHDLTDKYLAVEIAGRPVVSSFIHHADLYSAVPDVLVSGRQLVRDRDHNYACYIISPVRFASKDKKNRKLRSIDSDPRKSYWHSEKGKIPLEGSKTGGYVQDFVHVIKGTDGRPQRLGWRMKEYGLSTEQHGDSDLVLCKVYRTPRKASRSATPLAASTPAATAPTSALSINSKKRKAADPDDSSSSARPRFTEEHPRIALRSEPEESTEDGLIRMYCENMDDSGLVPEPASAYDAALRELVRPVTHDERIRAAMPNAPGPMEDLQGYLQCFEGFVKKTVAELVAQEKKAVQPQPEPERDDSFFQSMEQEFPSLYAPNRTNVAAIEDAVPAWAPPPQEDVGMI